MRKTSRKKTCLLNLLFGATGSIRLYEENAKKPSRTDSLEPDSDRRGIVGAEKARSRLARLGIREAECAALLEGGYVRTKYGMSFDLVAAGGIDVGWSVQQQQQTEGG